MINGKLGLKGKNIRILFWVMVDGTLQLMIYNAELKCVANIQKTKGGLFISKRSVSLAWIILVAYVLQRVKEQWAWSTRENDLLGSHCYMLHLFTTEWAECKDERCLLNCVHLNAGLVAWWSFIELWRCELYMKVYYCYSSLTSTQFTCITLLKHLFFYVFLFNDCLRC